MGIITIPSERIISRIFLIRGRKVMIDRDLAELYEVETRALNQAVKRNIARFPLDFMFQLNKQEAGIWRSQFVILKNRRGQHRKYLPYVFTVQGVAMLSSVLNSKRAIQVNIQIIRTFTQLGELLTTNKNLRIKIENMEKKYDTKLKQVFDVLKQLLIQESKPKGQIGFTK
ncbi:MAG: KilA-N, DNA-binding domain protein [Candidatus Giovannonibacteria bacterium GW2011_GWA2_44_13b]|uniref:KilA-N, DNA-binding domain protein n=2 Tax=Candidatus Giovannoniibacteriota TaxID=1752738 RepID=A0A0G1H409_9BACT|nr:MAG: KilA-N, DNA-binding domain protein [Candidatus Giovannonibacteria bacterium GW2011_GWA2_44_13b]OGF81591.1 MAG: DNA-binding protein [Candidatus Giovannonibacteria bacterium RIFCSPLOWO2_01_FULL_44_16]